MALYQTSLFDTPAEPVLTESSAWITGLLGGPLAVSLCVIAVALLGMLMLTGRLPLRRGGQVVVGCFLLLGSLTFAGGMTGLVRGEVRQAPSVAVLPNPVETALLTPSRDQNNPFDPYSGASLRHKQ